MKKKVHSLPTIIQSYTMDIGNEQFVRRQQSFRTAMQNFTIERDFPRRENMTLSEESADISPENKLNFDVNGMHSFTPSLLEIKKCVTRNHSSDSTSSDVSLLSTSSSSVPASHKMLWAIILTIFLLSSGTFAYILFKLNTMQEELNSTTVNKHDTGLCVPCANITVGPFEEDNEQIQRLQKKIIDGVEICCAAGPSQTLILANLIIERNLQIQTAQNSLGMEDREMKNRTQPPMKDNSTPKIAAHLLVGAQEYPKEGLTKQLYHIKNLQSSSPVAVSSGLKITSDRITVNTSGLYFVYSQIYFSKMYNEKNLQNPTSFYHYVYRYNVIYPNGGKQLLLKSIRTQCWARNKLFTDYSSYTAGAFQLAAGDSLYVLVSDISAVSRDSKASFFGLFKIA